MSSKPLLKRVLKKISRWAGLIIAFGGSVIHHQPPEVTPHGDGTGLVSPIKENSTSFWDNARIRAVDYWREVAAAEAARSYNHISSLYGKRDSDLNLARAKLRIDIYVLWEASKIAGQNEGIDAEVENLRAQLKEDYPRVEEQLNLIFFMMRDQPAHMVEQYILGLIYDETSP